MQTRKVYKVLAGLSGEQRKSFRLYLASPYLNSNGRLVRFMEILENDFPGREEADISPEEIWNKGLSQGPFHNNGFDKICAELLAALNAFLGMEIYQSRPESVAMYQLEAYLNNGLDELIPGLYKGISSKTAESFNHSPEGMYAQMYMLRSYSVFLFRQPRSPRGEWLIDIDEALNRYFLAQKLELAAALSNYNQLFHSELKLSDEDWMVGKLEKGFAEFPTYIRLQYLGYLTACGSEEHFRRLREELAAERESLPRDEGKHLYRLALNFCIFRLNQGEDAFEAEADGLQMELLETGWLLEDGLLSPEEFKNIVSLRLRQGMIDWTKDFIEGQEDSLTDDQGGAAILYNRTVLAFYEGNFGECIRGMDIVLRDFKSDVFYGMDARLFQIKALYERNEADDMRELESRLNSFRVFVMRNKTLGENEQGHYKNFVKQCRRLVALRDEVQDKKKEKIEKFLSGLAGLRPISNRKWFEMMASTLQNS